MNNKKGTLTVYAGPMYAGKTTALIAELEASLESNSNVLVVKPSIDNRYSEEDIISHDGVSLKKVTGRSVKRLPIDFDLDFKEMENIDVLLIDEAQFFTTICEYWVPVYLERGIDVVAVGLDMDSEGRPFGSMPFLLSLANNVYKLSGVCSVCSDEATRTFRKLSARSSDQVLIGGAETYEPRCLSCWSVGQSEKHRFIRS
jgi:thymidine kinase